MDLLEDARTKGHDSPLLLKPFHASELPAEMGRMVKSEAMPQKTTHGLRDQDIR
jgi:hypothetical protein